MNIKIHNGTTPSVRLCDSCTHSHIFQGEGSDDVVRCLQSYEGVFNVPLKVVKCNQYTSKADAMKPSLRTMQDSAYILGQFGPMKTLGFISVKDWRKRNKGEDILPSLIPDFD